MPSWSRKMIHTSEINPIHARTTTTDFWQSKYSLRGVSASTRRNIWSTARMQLLCKKLLKALQHPPQAQISPRWQEEQIRGWMKARENTSSSISNVHFGHYMVGNFNPRIAIINIKLANIPLDTGYSPTWWQKVLNVMLQKQLGNLQVKNLHIIVLFKVDFNMNNKYIWCEIMYKAKQLKILAPEQYGSQKRKQQIFRV